MVPLKALNYYWKNAEANSGALKIRIITKKRITKRPKENLLNFACTAIPSAEGVRQADLRFTPKVA
jgi:hypothetical protein